MVQVASFTEVGGHEVNEDAYLVQQHTNNADCWICCLADGQGGRAGGAAAARCACDAVMSAALAEDAKALMIESTWVRLLELADQTVMANNEAGYTTLIGFCIGASKLVGASSGDSEVMVATQGQNEPLIATTAQFKNPPVGSGAARFAPFAIPLLAHWAVIAMSDGVWKYAGREHIIAALGKEHGNKLIDIVQQRARLARSGSFQDDFTMVVLENE